MSEPLAGLTEILAARLVEVKTGHPDSYSALPADERRGWRKSAERILLDELIPAIRKQERERMREEILDLKEAIIVELTHGGITDEVAQVSTTLGALASSGIEPEEATALGQRLDSARDACRRRLEAAIAEPALDTLEDSDG